MKDLVLAVDVAKSKSTYGLFRRGGSPGEMECLVKPFDASHDTGGFNSLSGKLAGYDISSIDCFMEATGDYHEIDVSWLRKMGFGEPIVVNPVYVARAGRPSLRRTKTDRADCEKIARAYFSGSYQAPVALDGRQKEARKLSRLSEVYRDRLSDAKARLREALHLTFPEIGGMFHDDSLFQLRLLRLLAKYPTAAEIAKARIRAMVSAMEKGSKPMPSSEGLAKGIRDAAKSSVACSGPGSADAEAVRLAIDDVACLSRKAEQLDGKICSLLSGCTLYEVVLSFPGIGESTAAHLAAEIGPIEGFPKVAKLIASAGIEPRQKDSGGVEGNYGPITKAGNRHLRKWLFVAVMTILMQAARGRGDGSIAAYYQKMRGDAGRHHYASMVACMNKLLRKIFYRHREAVLTGTVSAR